MWWIGTCVLGFPNGVNLVIYYVCIENLMEGAWRNVCVFVLGNTNVSRPINKKQIL